MSMWCAVRLLPVYVCLFRGAVSSSFTVSASTPQFTDVPTWPDASYYDEDGPPTLLTCLIEHDPSVSLWWYKDGDLIHNEPGIAEITNHNQSLTFPVPKRFQTGIYKCLAINSLGNVSHSGYIYIAGRTQATRPRVVETDPDSLVQYSSLGNALNISCVFDVGGTRIALMDLELSWNKDNQTLNDSDHHTWGIGTTETNNQVFSLIITNLQSQDYGRYECLGQNHVGNDSRLLEISPPLPATVDMDRWFYIGGASAGFVLVVVFVVVIAIIIHRRKSLKQKYEKLEWAEPDMEHYEVPNYAVQYDVFISYCSDDQEWVKDVLFDKLLHNKYEVCIDFKDFTPGIAVLDNIMDAIYKSRKTIVVMSNNFLKSMWGQFELQQAHIRAVVQREDVLVLIKQDNCKVPPNLMGKTFLDWTDAGVQPHFWQRLYESIGEPVQIQTEAEVTTEVTTENGNGNQTENFTFWEPVHIQNEDEIQNKITTENGNGNQTENCTFREPVQDQIQNEAKEIQNEAITENRNEKQDQYFSNNRYLCLTSEQDDSVYTQDRVINSYDLRDIDSENGNQLIILV